jgi:hypothetical protein
MRVETYRVLAVLAVWVIFALLAALVILAQEANFIVIAILGFIAWVTTESVGNAFERDESQKAGEEKKKRSVDRQGDVGSLLQLLDENDLAELRVLVKQRLAEKLERGDDGELSTLDMLLAEQQELQEHQRRQR